MSSSEPRLLKGFRDILPEEMHLREYVIDTIRSVFRLHGFEPMETPAIELYEVLAGKGGEEAEKLMYRFKDLGGRDVGLRYELTISLARVMGMYPELTLPFRRYQIQPVWRAESPQRGRLREFYQCDVDVVGSASPLVDAELVAVVCRAMSSLGFTNYAVRISNRKILKAIAAAAGIPSGEEMAVCRAVDKLDKIGLGGIKGEMLERGFQSTSVGRVLELISVPGSTPEKLSGLREELSDQPMGLEGIGELEEMFEGLKHLGIEEQQALFDPGLARGLDYYTGPVYEVELSEPKIGSLGGGGRYDELIAQLGGPDLPATGVSLGLERIIIVMHELGMGPKHQASSVVMLCYFDSESLPYTLGVLADLRTAGIPSEVFSQRIKLKKQFQFADRRGIPFVCVAGPDEAAAATVTLKDLGTGKQTTVPRGELAQTITDLLSQKKV